MPYCVTCAEHRPLLVLVWCPMCRDYHNYGPATAALGVEERLTIRLCPACTHMAPSAEPEEETKEDTHAAVTETPEDEEAF